MASRIQQVWQISGGDLKRKRTWVAETKDVEGITFLKIEKWNRALVAFVTGKPLQLQAEHEVHHLSIPAWTALLDARSIACTESYHTAVREAAAAVGDPEPKLRAAREADCYLTGRIVNMSLPAVNFNNVAMPAMSMKALWSVSAPELWVELTELNLDYLWLYLKHGLAEHVMKQPELRRRKTLRKQPIKDTSPKKRARRSRRKARSEAPADEPEPAPLPPAPVEESSSSDS